MGLGAEIKAALNALSEADKKLFSPCWDAIGAVLDQLSSPGMIKMHGGATAPTGYLLCNGAAISRTTYGDLFAVIGETFGIGDGSTTFNLPDFRGIFPRGAGTNGNITKADGSDYSATLGASSDDMMFGHRHILHLSNANGNVGDDTQVSGGGTGTVQGLLRTTGGGSTNFSPQQVLTPIDDGANGTPNAGDETAPANLAVNFIIKT